MTTKDGNPYFDGYEHITIKISVKSVEGKKINSLKFTLKVFDKKGKSLGELDEEFSGSFNNQDVDEFKVFDMIDSDIYSLFKGSEVSDYNYGFEIRSMIYDGELIEVEPVESEDLNWY